MSGEIRCSKLPGTRVFQGALGEAEDIHMEGAEAPRGVDTRRVGDGGDEEAAELDTPRLPEACGGLGGPLPRDPHDAGA